MTTILDALHTAQTHLQGVSSTPRLDADLLMCHLLQMTRAQLIVHHHDIITDDISAQYQALIARRATAEPIAYLTNQREFYGRDYYVDQRVLVPRPETELLVELGITAAHKLHPTTIVDIGTGSGCVAISLALHTTAPLVIGTDLSREALAVARHNRSLHQANHVAFVATDLCTGIQPVSVIVSNPPYTILSDIDEGVRRHEPHLALIGGGEDGADIYRRLVALLPHHLRRPGFFACEIDARQGPLVAQLLRHTFVDGDIAIERDLAGHDRVVTLWLPPLPA